MVDTGQNEVQPLNPGETVTIPAGSKFRGYPVYNAVSPQPEPTPAEEINAIPQTGDNSFGAVTMIYVLAVASAIAFITIRKRQAL